MKYSCPDRLKSLHADTMQSVQLIYIKNSIYKKNEFNYG